MDPFSPADASSCEPRAKIVCTIGPSTSSVPMLADLIRAGMAVARLNFSHGTHADQEAALANLREAMRQTGNTVAVLQDLQGPKIRIGEFRQPAVELQAGAKFTITTEPVVGTEALVSTTFVNLPLDVNAGSTVLLDDGRIRLRVVSVEGPRVHTEVVTGGRLSSHKGINLPGVSVSAPSLTDKDLEDLRFGIAHDIDYVAQSFVRSRDDVRSLRRAIARLAPPERPVPIIAKIEKPQAVEHIDGIIEEADGIMVARGDLGVELPQEDVPMLQKEIVGKCNSAGSPVIVATQMLESMIRNPAPTRAETSDVANAVVDGCDAVMLSGETAVGSYPLEAVRMMRRIICRVEDVRQGLENVLDRPLSVAEGQHDALGRAACILAEQLNAAAIVTITHSGTTARAVSRYRPDPQIIALTLDPKVLRLVNLLWGVRGYLVEGLPGNSDEALHAINERLRDSGLIRPGQQIVLLAGQPLFARGSTNFIKVEKME